MVISNSTSPSYTSLAELKSMDPMGFRFSWYMLTLGQGNEIFISSPSIPSCSKAAIVDAPMLMAEPVGGEREELRWSGFQERVWGLDRDKKRIAVKHVLLPRGFTLAARSKTM